MSYQFFNPDMHADGVITYKVPKGGKKIFKRLAEETGLNFKRVKNPNKADIIIKYEDELSYGRWSPARGWHIHRSGVSYIGIKSDIPKRERYGVTVHELGHAFGLDHYDGGVMEPPTNDWEWFSDAHITQITDTFL